MQSCIHACILSLRAMDSPPQDLVAGATVSLGRVDLLAPLFSRLDAHAPVTLVALGSSVTARAGGCSHSIIDGSVSNCCGATCTSRSSGFLRSFFDYINRTWPHTEHKLFNAGVPASMPSTYVECLETWLPRDSNGSSVDLFIVEFVAVKLAEADCVDAVVVCLTKDIALLLEFFRSTHAHCYSDATILARNGSSSDGFIRCRVRNVPSALSEASSSLNGSRSPFSEFLACLRQRAALKEWINVSWAEQQRRVGQAHCGKHDARSDHQRLRRSQGTMGSSRWCWAPVRQAPDGMHPSEIGSRFMAEAMIYNFQNCYARYAQYASTSRNHHVRAGPFTTSSSATAIGHAPAVLGNTLTKNVAELDWEEEDPEGIEREASEADYAATSTVACYSFDARRGNNKPAMREALRSYVSKRNPSSGSSDETTNAEVRKLERYSQSHSVTRERVGVDAGASLVCMLGSLPRIVSSRGFRFTLDPVHTVSTSIRGTLQHGLTPHPSSSTELKNNGHRDAERKEHLREAKASYESHCPGAFAELDIGIGSKLSNTLKSQNFSKSYAAIDFVQSWRGMGRLIVTCTAGCSCDSTEIDAYSPDRVTVRSLRFLELSRLDRCILQLAVSDSSSSGGFSFKVTRVSVGGMSSSRLTLSAAYAINAGKSHEIKSKLAAGGVTSHVELSAHVGNIAESASLGGNISQTRVCDSGLKGDARGLPRCENFCREKNAPRHCLFCKCKACGFCTSPLSTRAHRRQDLEAAADFSKRVPPPPPPGMPPVLPPPPPSYRCSTPLHVHRHGMGASAVACDAACFSSHGTAEKCASCACVQCGGRLASTTV